VLGHVQRGGSPSAFDRVLASRMGTAAVKALAQGESGVMIGLRGRQMKRIPLVEVIGKLRPLDPDIYGGVGGGLGEHERERERVSRTTTSRGRAELVGGCEWARFTNKPRGATAKDPSVEDGHYSFCLDPDRTKVILI
jgi:hypothetical protein